MAESIGTSSTLPTRQWAHVQRSRPMFELSESDRPAIAYKPDAALPVSFMDKSNDDFIVIPKGRIVAVNTNGDLVPANGGTTASYTYTINDQNAGVLKSNGTLANQGDTYSNTANVPVGVAPQDFFQDISGRYNNYRYNTTAYGILCERTVEVPYFTNADLGGSNTAATTAALTVTKTLAVAYGNQNATDLSAGDWVMPDANGNYVKWDPTAAAAAIVGNIQQVVGQVLLIDSLYPKDMLQHVQTYPYSEMAGSETGGFPGHLAESGAIRAAVIRLKF